MAEYSASSGRGPAALWACVFFSLRERVIAPGSRDAPRRWGGDFPSGPETHADVNAEPSSNPWNTKRGLRNEWAQAPRRNAIYENEAGGLPGRRFPQVKLRGAHGGADQRASFPELIPGRRHHEMPGPGSRGAAVETLPPSRWGVAAVVHPPPGRQGTHSLTESTAVRLMSGGLRPPHWTDADAV